MDPDEPGIVQDTTNTFIIHPRFNWRNFNFDIGLARLSSPVEFNDRIQPIRLPESGSFVEPGRPLIVSGWGRTTDAEPDISRYLNYVNVESISNADCTTVFGNIVHDGGGPLVSYDYDDDIEGSYNVTATLQGVASFISGAGCEAGHPSGFLRITEVRDWIRENTVRQITNSEKQAELIMDGQKTHISLRVVDVAVSARILLLKLPSHLTHHIQPLDKCVFGSLKTGWIQPQKSTGDSIIEDPYDDITEDHDSDKEIKILPDFETVGPTQIQGTHSFTVLPKPKDIEKKNGLLWLKGFLERIRISVAKPEATSINRIIAFNKIEVSLFYQNLKKIIETHKFLPKNIYNCDETGISIVQDWRKILATKG
ncbi:chymotrypsin-related [Holotrichia oblita]|uniref:Chymotrypsin-related n=1 Tax=Holotrichia oblita TaxID=644536 RepID=A0ACB9SW64_HOLOL|nr:chymotrypsin-related [Holotrichia oblita]